MRKLALFLFFVPAIACGWGETGHKTVCEIAYEELTAAARLEVDRLIDLDPEFDTFSESCLFADGPPRQRTEDHYINVPRSALAITTNACPMADTCLFSAIEGDTNVLADTNNSNADRLFALKLLGHWLGDIHQPMHVSYQDDRGANSIGQKGDDNGGNLHGAWDYDIVEQRIGTDFRVITDELRADVTESDRTLWSFDSPVEWANESYQITISAKVEYCTQQQGACWYGPNNMMLNRGEQRREVAIDDIYTASHSRTVERRLQQAGVRLGSLLNSILR